MFSVVLETSSGIERFTAKSFYQVLFEGGKIKVKWERAKDGRYEDFSVTYARIKSIREQQEKRE